MPEHCPFCAIAQRQAEAAIVHEDAHTMIFVDLRPIRRGHLQIIPKAHYPCFEDLTADLAARVIHLGQRYARVLKRLYDVPRVAFVFSGNDVAHTHAHLIPLHMASDITSRRYIANERLRFVPLPEPTLQDRQIVAREIRVAAASTSAR